MRKVQSAAAALMVAGLLSVISCGGAIVDDISDAPKISTLISTTDKGPISAAAAAYAVTRSAGEAASEAQVPTFMVQKGGNSITGYSFDSLNGVWTTTGANDETVTVSFYSTLNLDSGTIILADITDSDNFASGGSLKDLLDPLNGGLLVSKILMELEVSTKVRTFSGILVSSVWIKYITDGGDIKSKRIGYATGTTASYSLTGEGFGTLISGETIVITSLTATVTSLGASVTGEAEFSIPLDDDMEYTVSCSFGATGCTSGTVLDSSGVSAGTISPSDTDIVFTDLDGVDTIISW
jgi:hypothetical protein